MATPAQIAANQSNAEFSTGPKTVEGKAASAKNRLNLGFRSATVLLPTDDPAEYEALLEELTTHFGPNDLTRTDLTEDRFVREMADAEWRLRRVRTCMSAALARQMEQLAAEFPDLADDHIARESRAIETRAETGCSHATWLRYETKFERQYDRAYRAWARYQEERRRVADKETDISMKKAVFAPLPTEQPSKQAAVQPTENLGSNVQIARNAPCPCKSGEKYKRCCGRTAPGQINIGVAA